MRKLLVLALALNAVGLLVPTAIVPGYALLLASIFVLGVGTTLLQVAGNPIMRDVSAEGRYARNLSFAQGIKGVGSAGATGLVALLAVGEDWRKVFPYFLAAMLLCLVFVLPLRVKEQRAEVPPSVGSSLGLLREPIFGLAVLGIFLYVGSEVCLSTWLKPRLVDLQMAERHAGILGPTFFFGCLTVGRLLGSAILHFFSARSFFRLSAVTGAVGVLALMGGHPWLVVGGVALCGLGFGNIWPLLFSLTVEARPGRSAELSGLMCMAISGGAVLPPLMGAIQDHVSLAAAFVVPLVAFIYLVVLSFRGRQQAQEA
jgi:fucose permease